MRNRELEQLLRGHSLTTAEILYKMPDHKHLVQTYVWQEYDRHPLFPKLLAFLHFWTTELHGPLHIIRVAHSKLIQPREFRYVDGRLVIH